jgi:uncharacterized delta-60 repeat protein
MCFQSSNRVQKVVAATVMLLALIAAVARGQSALDGFDPNPGSGSVRVAVVQPDGKTLIGGNFVTLSPNGGATVPRNGIARLNPDGTLDMAFDPDANGSVWAIVLQPDGKILVSGAFTSIGGQQRNYIARLNGTTGLADSFNPSPNDFVVAMALQTDGKILVGGNFLGPNSIGGQARNYMARLDPGTGLADSFNPAANGFVQSIVVQADAKILVAGSFTNIGGQQRHYVARLDAMAGLADSFNPDADFPVSALAIQADGRIVAGGQFGHIGGQTRNFIARLDGTTGLADSFDPDAQFEVAAIAIQPDSKILVGGEFSSIGGQQRHYTARLDAATGLADSFDPKPDANVVSIAIQKDGKTLVCGAFGALAPNGGATIIRKSIARLESDGRLDQTLGPNIANSVVFATAVQPDNKILIGGNFTTVLGVGRNHIARLNTDGTLDTAFNPNANDMVSSIAVQADGKILAGGFFTTIGGQTRALIARLDAATGLADSFNPNVAGFNIYSIVVQADAKVLIVGGITAVGGHPRHHIARLDPTTGEADSFNPNANTDVFSIAIQADGKILVGGNFNGTNSIGGQTRNYIARLDPTTGMADSFDPNADADVISVATQADGKILAAGAFTRIGGQTRNHIARLDPATGTADSFDPNANDWVVSLALQTDGKILAGGQFITVGGQVRNNIARLDSTTGLADSFNPTANFSVLSIAIQKDGKVLLGGDFSSIGGQARSFFARLSDDTAALQNLAVAQSTITWTFGGSSPQLTRATFEYSTDNVNYTPLGNGTEGGSSWTLTGLSLPTGPAFYVRARGLYRSGYQNGSENITESIRYGSAAIPGPTPRPVTLGNISTRLRVETDDNVLIGGFIINGTQPKKVVVRAIGPSLSSLDALTDPVLELRDSSGALIRSNDNWRSDQEAEIIATGIPPSNDLESGIVATLPANNSAYTAIVRGVNNGTGVGLVEAYDLDRTVDSELANISTRGSVQTGDNVLIGGVIVVGQDSLRVIVRAIGPSLNITGELADPTLELRDMNGALIRSNDNWRSAQEAEIIATGIPPTNDLEPAIVQNLAPGNYTAIVRGVNGTTGIALVEVYALN